MKKKPINPGGPERPLDRARRARAQIPRPRPSPLPTGTWRRARRQRGSRRRGGPVRRGAAISPLRPRAPAPRRRRACLRPLFRRPDDRFSSIAAALARRARRIARAPPPRAVASPLLGASRVPGGRVLLAAPDALPGRPVLASRRDDLRRDGLGLRGVQGPAGARPARIVLVDGRRAAADAPRAAPRRLRNLDATPPPPHATPAPTPRRAGARAAGPHARGGLLLRS